MRLSNEIKIIILIALLTILGLVFWLFRETNKPEFGTAVEDKGQEHVLVGTQVFYNSNPPTTGSHYADWIRAGVYDSPKDDRNLIHSLEHGYIIMSYNCDLESDEQSSSSSKVIRSKEASFSAQLATDSASLGDKFSKDDCKNLINQLTDVYNSKGKRKLIVIPRPQLDSRIAITAWTRLDKLSDLDEQSSSATKKRIEQFIDRYRDQGPERTME